MSMDPANTLPPEYDDALPKDYDPAYTADISTKMRVPDVIGVTGNSHPDIGQLMNGHAEELHDKARTAHMNIPDKLIYTGNNESQGMRKDPTLHLDLDLECDRQHFIGLSTPPRHLTLDDAFRAETQRLEVERSLEEDMNIYKEEQSRDMPLRNGYVTPSPQHTRDSLPLDASMFSTPGGSMVPHGDARVDDMLIVRRQIERLSRQVMRLEHENQRRSQRELILYPLVLGYVLLQVVKFFASK